MFKSRQGGSSFFTKPQRTKTIEPMIDYYHPLHRKNISSMEWTIGSVNQVELAERQLLLKSRNSFFEKTETRSRWKQSTISWKD